jgi:hypothetical protein
MLPGLPAVVTLVVVINLEFLATACPMTLFIQSEAGFVWERYLMC